jgi:F0F1-type ATP synthase membrane subunit a
VVEIINLLGGPHRYRTIGKSEGVGLTLTISLWEVALAVLFLNIPFGFWRDGTKRFTLPWFLAVHLPVPVVVGLRILSKLGWRLTTLPVLVGSFFLGQLLGGKIHQWWEWRKDVRGN